MTRDLLVRSTTAVVLALALAGCAVGPEYRRPDAPVPAAYRQAASAPASAAGATWTAGGQSGAPLSPREWWRLFDDAELDALASRVASDNFDVAAAAAAYAQARAIVGENRAARFPSVGAGVSARRDGGREVASSRGFDASIQADWAPDLWGRVRRSVEAAQANAEASAADLAGARLAAESELARNYFELREADAEIALLERTIEGYRRSFTIASNRYEAGIVARTDVQQAETQLANTEADLAARRADRARYEHAIAILLGRAPADFALPAAAWRQVVPSVPVGVPSTLLERRPDIAAAERDIAAANAQIGIAQSARFPSLTLSGSLGSGGTRVGDLFSASTALWSIGASLAQTVFDAGATRSRVEQAEHVRDITVARYRQTVLAAFVDVEDLLVNARTLAAQEVLRRTASDAADRTEQQIENRYRAGQLSYTDVVTAQASALSARRALVQTVVARQTNAIALIRAIGGGWTADEPVSLR